MCHSETLKFKNIGTFTLLGDLGWDSLERRRSTQIATILFKAPHNPSPTCLLF